ncbi:MAG TPA: repressor LexA [Lentisphaeria bacterium]|nr:MAG: repressor LexA [Lentisphaerae bacterium GWF2_49_21]HBC89428.1 repressor LexA [Lentisphaeria bacterium]
MRGLTDKQRNMLDFIEKFSDSKGMAPTVYEIADYFRIKTSTVFAHLQSLQKKKFITRTSQARSITLFGKTKQHRHTSFVLAIPLLGRISAGLPLDSSELREGEVYCDSSMFKGEDTARLFALRINGDSMKNLGILDGDYVIVRKSSVAQEGDIVVALAGDETTVKSYYPRGGKIALKPANPKFKTQIYVAEEVKIQGKVIGLQRTFAS